MPKRIAGKDGMTAFVEFAPEELAAFLEIDLEELETWRSSLPSARVDAGRPVYVVHSKAELALLRKRALILRTRMSERALQNLEKEGVLDAYAALAEDCPEGLTAHVWRSYGLVVLMQIRHGVKIDAEELARRARLAEVDPKTGQTVLGVEMAKKHLRLLQALGYLKSVEVGDLVRVGERNYTADKSEWLHKGLPRAWARLA